MKNLNWTKHAVTRSQQRGFGRMQVETLCQLADLFTPVARGADAFRVSRKALAEAVAEGLCRKDADRLSGRVAVVADDGSIVTLAHLAGRKARAYKRRDRRAISDGVCDQRRRWSQNAG